MHTLVNPHQAPDFPLVAGCTPACQMHRWDPSCWALSKAAHRPWPLASGRALDRILQPPKLRPNSCYVLPNASTWHLNSAGWRLPTAASALEAPLHSQM